MKKTLEEILSEPVNIEDLIRTEKVIDKLIEKSKEAGVEWPETEEPLNPEDYVLIEENSGSCEQCVFFIAPENKKDARCHVHSDGRFNCWRGHFERGEVEVSSFNDVE